MKNYLIAERYAGALSEAIEDPAELDAALHTLTTFQELYQSVHDLHVALDNPIIKFESRRKVLDGILGRLEASERVQRLLHLLLERDRMTLVPDVAEVFNDLVDERLNRLTARVTTALPLSDEQKEQLRDGLSRYSGAQVRLVCRENPEIIGGIIAKLEGVLIDGSLRSRLNRLREALVAE